MGLHKLNLFKTTDATHQFQLRADGSLNDQVEILWDDVTETIRVWYYTSQADYDAGTGEEVFDETPVQTSAIPLAVYSDYKFCEGTTLVQFVTRWNFPFYVRETTANSYICSQVVCDIAWSGTPIITPAASAETTGRVLVSATSSNGNIEYWPGPFNYGYGSPIGDFNLLPGTYQIFAIDASGCYTSITLQIPIGGGDVETHFLKFYATYSNLLGERTRIEILEKNFDGEAVELGTDNRPQLAASPFVVSWGKNQEKKSHPIKVSEASLKLISYVDYEFLQFYTNETQFYKVQIKRGDEDGDILWWGYVTPELYGEPYTHPPYVVNLVCNDGLGDLQKIPFALVNVLYDVLSPYTGRMTHLQVVVECLKKIGNDLPIYTAINTNEDSMGYEDVPNILKYTFTTDVDEVYPNELEEGVKYIFKVKNNLNIGIYYGDELIYSGTPASTGLVNGDFSDNLNGWSQSQNGFSSEPWVWFDITTVLFDKVASIDTSAVKSNYLFQAFNFAAGTEYTLNISAYRYLWAHVDSRYRIKASIGIPGADQIIYDSGDKDSTAAQIIEISQVFTPSQAYGYLYIWFEFSMGPDSYGQFFMDSVEIVGEPSTGGEATFEYTPSVSHEDITIDVVGGGSTTVEIYETIQDAFNQVYVNTDNYTAEGGMSCFAVLQEQLKPYGARMYQANGAWHIVRFDQQNTQYLRNKYDKDGVFIESEYYQPILNITHPSASVENIWINNDMFLEMTSGFRSQTVEQDLGYVENLIRGGDLNSIDGWSYGAIQNEDPEFFEFTQLDHDNYAINWSNKAQAVLFYSIHKIKAFFDYMIPREGVPATGELVDGDVVIIGNAANKVDSGIYRVVKDGPWTRIPVLAQDVFLPSYGGFGSLFTVTQAGSDYTATPYTYESLAEIYKESFWIRNEAVNIEYASGDAINFKINKKLEYFGSTDQDIRLRLEVKVGDLYLSDDYVFTQYYNFLEIPLEIDKAFNTIDFKAWFSTAGTGDMTIKIFPSNHSGIDLGDTDAWGGIDLDFGLNFSPQPEFLIDYVKAIYMPQGLLPEKDRTQLMNNSKKFHMVPDAIEVLHGDSPEVLNRDKIYSYYLTLKDGTLTKKWHRKGFYESKNLLKLLLEIVLSNNLNNNELITGNIRNLLTLNDVIFDPQNPERLFMMNYVQWDEMNHTSNVEIVEIVGLPEDEEAAFSYGFSLGFKS
jgi:hypothetical protein